jgi:N-acetylglucosaminyl-diphospho-decaprenol L-rhamnosyltransferase
MPGTPDLTIENIGLVSVTYNSTNLAQFMAQTAQHFKNVWIVDNCSDDNPLEKFQKNIPHANVLALNENLGFGAANNVGFRESLNTSLEYTLFLNPDCQISPDNVLKLLQTLKSRPKTGIVCPRVYDESGKAYDTLSCDYKTPYREKQVQRIKLDGSAEPIVDNGYLEGACFLVKNEVFNKMGGFNENLFMYCEEDDIGLRLNREGYEIATDTGASAIHIGGASTPRSLRILIRKAYHVRWSRFYMTNTYVGRGKRILEVLKTLVAALIALPLYGIFLRKKHCIKWTGSLFAALDSITMSKHFRKYF